MVKIIIKLIPFLLAQLPKEIVKDGIDRLLDVIENAVEKSETNLDNVAILPICKLIRDSLDIPDNDE